MQILENEKGEKKWKLDLENFLDWNILFRGKEKLEQLPWKQFLQASEIYRALLRTKQVGEKQGKVQKPVKIAHKAVVLIFLSL